MPNGVGGVVATFGQDTLDDLCSRPGEQILAPGPGEQIVRAQRQPVGLTVGASKASVSRSLAELRAERLVEREGEGKRGDAYRYWLTRTAPDGGDEEVQPSGNGRPSDDDLEQLADLYRQGKT